MLFEKKIPIKSMMTIGSLLSSLGFLELNCCSLRRKAATYGVKIAVYITKISMIQSQTALNGE